jgi:hypothetical protein
MFLAYLVWCPESVLPMGVAYCCGMVGPTLVGLFKQSG